MYSVDYEYGESRVNSVECFSTDLVLVLAQHFQTFNSISRALQSICVKRATDNSTSCYLKCTCIAPILVLILIIN